MVDLDAVETDEDVETIKTMLSKHAEVTHSTVAQKILDDWKNYQSRFIKVMPTDYKRVLAAIEKARAEGTSEDDAVMEAAHG
jgi:glutamate synthase domain-containing protein 3